VGSCFSESVAASCSCGDDNVLVYTVLHVAKIDMNVYDCGIGFHHRNHTARCNSPRLDPAQLVFSLGITRDRVHFILGESQTVESSCDFINDH